MNRNTKHHRKKEWINSFYPLAELDQNAFQFEPEPTLTVREESLNVVDTKNG